MTWSVEQRRSLYLPAIDWYLDAREPRPQSFVSHAHFDHLAAHQTILCSEGTARLMAARLPGSRDEIVLPFEKPYELGSDTTVTLFPAGHIHGSAQWLSENADGRLLYTGDFKLRPGRSAEVCATPRADLLIMETTFGLPRYVFPPTEQVLTDILAFCHAAIDDHKVPVLFGYSLGKSQEILRSLAFAQLPVMLHPETLKMTRIYEELGIDFPPFKPFARDDVAGHVVICPPQASNSRWLRAIPQKRTAAITGWAMDPGAVYRYQCDAVFPLSDHADFHDLLTFVEKVRPEKVLTVHGFAREFAQTLRSRGIEAWAIGMENQLELEILPAVSKTSFTEPALSKPHVAQSESPDSFFRFAAIAEKVRSLPGTSDKSGCVADYLKSLDEHALGLASIYFTGRPFPQAEGRALNLGWAMIKRAILGASGATTGDFANLYARFRDGGDTAAAILSTAAQPSTIRLRDVGAFFDAVTGMRNQLQKLDQLQQLLLRLSPNEIRYLIRIITGDMRIGFKEGLVEDALAKAFGRPLASVRDAVLRCGDIGRVAQAAKYNGLDEVDLQLFHPLQVMLASPEPTADAIIRRLGETVWVEDKYDGIRCQIHKSGRRTELYSRDLRRITDQFPELIRSASALDDDFIADGELLAWRNGRALPFADLQRRLGRRGDDLFLGEEIPVSLSLFDVLWANGQSLLKSPLRERRAVLDALSLSQTILVAPARTVTGAAALDQDFQEARDRGNEGLIIKDPESAYQPGRRGFSWVKLKKAFETLDVVVVAAEYGHGKRRDVLSDYTFAVRDETNGMLLTVGKAYSGLTDKEIAQLTEHFLARTIEVRGRMRIVEPDTVLEIAFDSIRPSKRHDSGFALRFPRIARIRTDKNAEEIDTLARCRQLASIQS